MTMMQAPTPTPTSSRSPRLLWWIVGTLLAAAAVVLAALLLRSPAPPNAVTATTPQAAPSTATPTTTPTASFTPQSAVAAYRLMSEVRIQALQTANISELRKLYAPNCTCLMRDESIIRSLRQNGQFLKGSPLVINHVTVQEFEPRTKTAVLRVEAFARDAEFVNKNGRLVDTEKGAGVQRYQVNLEWSGRTWLVSAIFALK
jgi:hypothetical protein